MAARFMEEKAKSKKRCGPSLSIPQSCSRRQSPLSGGRAQVLHRGVRGMDAEQGTMGQGWPVETTLGAAPERGKSERSEDPHGGANGFGYFCPDKSDPPSRAEPALSASTGNRAYQRKSHGLPIRTQTLSPHQRSSRPQPPHRLRRHHQQTRKPSHRLLSCPPLL